MKKLGEVLLQEDPFTELVLGNTAVARGMAEAGVGVATSYPGSPTPEIATAILSIPVERRPFYFEFSVNEKVATEVACGASLNGRLSCVFFKSVGLNVAADSLVQLSLMELAGGMVVVLGDDPGANSSQNEQDNRHFARMAALPVLEPADPGEAYLFFLEAARQARARRMAVILRLTTHVCHAKGLVGFGRLERRAADYTPRFDPLLGPYIPITSTVFPLKRKALEKLAAFGEWSDSPGLNPVFDHGNRKRGIITAGLPALSALDVLEGVTGKPDVLKLGVVHPLPAKTVRAFLESHEEVRVLEELDDEIERSVKVLAYDAGLSARVAGKAGVEDWLGEYTPDKVEDILRAAWPDLFTASPGSGPVAPAPALSPRPPQMCPGCGHRSAFYAIAKALPKDAVTVADIGCHTLGFLPPYSMGQVLLSMGHSTGTGSGLALFNTTRPVVAFLGDSTFFHAGLPGIVNALFNRHNLTLVIMENGTTAMTGHQDHPGTGQNVLGPAEAIPVKRVLEGLGVKNIREVDTYSQAKLTGMVREAITEEGFKVIIARHPCMLKMTREARRKPGFVQRRVRILQETCEKIHECVESFACPTFQRAVDGTVTVSPELCIGDGSCIQACPVKAIEPETEAGGKKP
jgi:indolepyruvate ferredoxin oxidoreductase alpha subunit